MDSIKIKDKEFDLFLSQPVIQKGIDRIAGQINEELADKAPLFIVILNGAFIFASELISQFNHPCEVTFLRLQSYEGTGRGMGMKTVFGLIDDIEGRNIVIVEDIIDTGHTMAHLLDYFGKKNPASIRIAALLFKPKALQMDIRPDYVAMEIPNDFIVGYGLDYDGYGRNLRNIYKVRP